MIFLEKRCLGELALKAASKYQGKTCFQIYRDGGVYDKMSYAEFGIKTRQIAGLLMDKGVKAGDRVMILAENRPEWPIAYFGITLIGAVAVPVLTDFIGEQISTIARHAEISALCHTERTVQKIAEGGIDGAIALIPLDDPNLFSNLRIPEETEFPTLTEHNPAAIIYTSGTTGSSKGVVLSHGNLIFTAQASRTLMKIFSRDRLLSVIPLAHTYECVLGLFTAVMGGASVTYLDKPPSPAVLLPAMQTLRPTAIVSVPLFIEKICRNSIFPGMKKSPLYKFPLTRVLAIKAAGARLMTALGSSVRFFGIGGAPLDEDVERFLRKAGFPYAPGYGLTETAPLVAGTDPYKFAFRSAGSVVKGVETRISPEGEIQVRGPNVMLGYYRDEERTRKAFTEDGWFKTGDLGYIDKKGNLFMKGRIKALILGPSGENIYPEEIESILHNSLLVEDALVVPGERGELVALIVLSEKAKTALAAMGDSLEELKNSVNKKLAAFSRLNRIEIRSEPFEKTPTLKIKRFLYAREKS
ncbi:AMP-binding protein [Leadbettera azotonutricia]|uniref:Putative long-chain-fatty-acid--CoA ligase n=1 Tax=Leadbettera azotonutricia (strain ATCC BAA-888 / DSM 13862 / ZAS-9) TaxID=545695 RepID=F5Y9W3_LEAAZ|nr:AMP-binding protein [Leadbettera azotonutricia]AEF82896.1 putative long-chain-fatty-acid--CoA ligase [Leadbettera azotonutricia ZAS-9]